MSLAHQPFTSSGGKHLRRYMQHMKKCYLTGECSMIAMCMISCFPPTTVPVACTCTNPGAQLNSTGQETDYHKRAWQKQTKMERILWNRPNTIQIIRPLKCLHCRRVPPTLLVDAAAKKESARRNDPQVLRCSTVLAICRPKCPAKSIDYR